MRAGFLQGIKAEAMQYLVDHPDPRECTITKMIKEGGVRKTSVSRKFLKKHMKELEERGLLYSIDVNDPISKIKYTYYTMKPKSDGSAQVKPKCFGVPKYIIDNWRGLHKDLLHYYGWRVLSGITGIVSLNCCTLCKKFEESLKEKLNCERFYQIHLALRHPDDLIQMGMTPVQIQELSEIEDAWGKTAGTFREQSSQFFLEDLTFALLECLLVYPGLDLDCESCAKWKECLKKGQGWVSEFLKEYFEKPSSSMFFDSDSSYIHPQNDLTRFWRSVLAGAPDIKTELLYSYFAQRFNLEKEHNITNILKILGSRNFLPQFYSKAIPISIELMHNSITNMLRRPPRVFFAHRTTKRLKRN